MHKQHALRRDVNSEALRWIKALQKGEHNAGAGFAAWLRVSPQHVEAYCLQKMLETELRGIDLQRQIDVHALIERARIQIRRKKDVIP